MSDPLRHPDPTEAAFSAARNPPPDPDFGGGAIQSRGPISEQVAGRILGMIRTGNLRSGDRLPTEAHMTVAFGISRPPLREALKALTLMGVLESRQGGRYTVTDLSPARLVTPFNIMLSVSDYNPVEHFEARSVVDAELVRLTALRATEEQRCKIARLAEDGAAFLDDPVGFRLLDLEFHRTLYDSAGNAMLSAVAQGLYDVGLDLRRIASALPGVIATSVGQHVEIARAILAGDGDVAAAAYRHHNDHVLETTIRSIDLRTNEDQP